MHDDNSEKVRPNVTDESEPQKATVTRRGFLSQSALAGAGALALKNVTARDLESGPPRGTTTAIQTSAGRVKSLDLASFARREQAYAVPADAIVGLSEEAVNAFLAAHFTNNPKFYDRGRDKGVPIYELKLNDHGKPVTIKFFAKITKIGNNPAVSIDLRQVATTQQRFAAWWRATHGAQSVTNETKLPPNILINVPSAILQVDFPKQDGSGTYHQVDFHCSIATAAFMLLKDDAGTKALQLIDWDIVVTPVDDPLDPNNPIWGPGNPACTEELMRLRLMIRDAFTLGANVALTELSKTLTRTLPLPPLDVIKGTNIVPRELFINDQTIAVSATLEPKAYSEQLLSRFEMEMQRFEDDLAASGIDIQDVFMKAPKNDPAKLEEYLARNVSAYRNLTQRHTMLKQSVGPTKELAPAAVQQLPTNNIFVMLSGNVFDVLAKAYLTADKGDCTPWWRPVDIIIGYAQGRACYWFKLSGAHGALSGTTISGGCNVKAGGGLELQACIRIPCAPDQCATYKPGFGLKGPMNISLTLGNLSWNNNSALKLKAHVDDFPGFEIYGLPPVVGDIANAIINWISSTAMKAFLNAALSLIDFTIIQIPAKIPGANVDLKVDQFGVSNVQGMLTVTGRTKFS
jgi:hypothetical protein